MKKIVMLLLGLAMVAFNAIAGVNVNTATQEQLETLNGIGPAKAKAIIDHRTKNGPFKKIEDLDNVPGIGQGVLGKIKGDVTLTGPTTVKAEPKKADTKPAEKKAEPAKAAAPAPKAEEKKPEAKPAEKKAEPAKPAAKAEEKKAEKKADAKADKAAKKEEKK